jgi:hypothetical protein
LSAKIVWSRPIPTLAVLSTMPTRAPRCRTMMWPGSTRSPP